MCFMIALQLLRHFVRPGFIQSHWLVPSSATCIDEKSPAHPGIPKDACWRLPDSFSRIFIGIFIVDILMLWSCSRVFFTLSAGKRSV